MVDSRPTTFVRMCFNTTCYLYRPKVTTSSQRQFVRVLSSMLLAQLCTTTTRPGTRYPSPAALSPYCFLGVIFIRIGRSGLWALILVSLSVGYGSAIGCPSGW